MRTAVVIPNLNGGDSLVSCLDSLQNQSVPVTIIVVENASIDDSLQILQEKYPDVTVLVQSRNLGFAGGVNAGIQKAMELDMTYVALFNNDAVADKEWTKELQSYLDSQPEVGIATGKFMNASGDSLDSTGEGYTTWGLPFPRGRGEAVDTYNEPELVFGATGGASMYRVDTLKEVGLFDEDFFAYYEDVDISFRAQWAGWKVGYVPAARAYHQIGATSGKIKGFTTYQAMKNLPWVFWKNAPSSLFFKVYPRLALSLWLFLFSAIVHGNGWPAIKGIFHSLVLTPKKLGERRRIMGSAKVPASYIASIMVWDLPPAAHNLRALRSKWWHLIRRGA